ncbi:hypothetical protein GH714_002974 [Hevea brasiliensis]|uniref:Adenylate isopentenyltransferase n=1 Tax=Hevea brasiliensis TaxID=3981 RepID=A0A6A6KG37_HEVBR|nr:hypothetical protein GH714_002974 [Hevea brasiliensis]
MNMRFSASVQKQIQPLVNLQRAINMEPFFRRKDKVVFVVGPTGTGKSRLAIDLATRIPAEVVNCDKMQVYKGLDIVTNKVTQEECRGVPHHLIGVVVDPNANFTCDDFRYHASDAVQSIVARDRLPIIAGGSNSFIEALANEDPDFRLSRWSWNMHRIDATEVFLKSGEEAEEAWEKLVAGPSSMIVERFFYDEDHMAAIVPSPIPIPAMAAAATR